MIVVIKDGRPYYRFRTLIEGLNSLHLGNRTTNGLALRLRLSREALQTNRGAFGFLRGFTVIVIKVIPKAIIFTRGVDPDKSGKATASFFTGVEWDVHGRVVGPEGEGRIQKAFRDEELGAIEKRVDTVAID